MTNALTLRNGDMIRSVADLMAISEMLVKSGMLPNGIKTKEAAAAIILKGREIGMPMMESFSLINVIQGKPTIAPQGMIALAQRSGELEDLQIIDDGETCTVTVKRKGKSAFKSSFSVKDAAAMQLGNKDNWQKQPKVMRQWRAIAANFRITFPDVIGGMYTPEEMGATVDEDGEVVEGTATVIETPAQPMPHWAKIPDVWGDFATEAKMLGYNNDTAKAVLKVEKFTDYQGTFEDAITTLREHKTAQAQAQPA